MRYLTPYLLKKVDERKLPLTVGVSLSHLSPESQRLVEDFFFEQRSLPITQSMADKLRGLEERGALAMEALEREFLSPPVVETLKSVSLPVKKLRKYFDSTATEQEVVRTIEEALRAYFAAKEGQTTL